MENLTDIRKRIKARRGRASRRLHGWSFAKLRTFVTYKAEAKGVAVVFIDPRHTSQTCRKCGYQHRSNRKTQSMFECRGCGYTVNADLNASFNIRNKHLGIFGKPLDARPPSVGPTSRKTQCGRPKGAARKSPHS